MQQRSRAKTLNIGPERSLGELVPFSLRREATTVTPLVRRSKLTAKQRYPEDGAIVDALVRGGIDRIYGIFGLDSWRAATAAAELYLLPFGRQARADVSALLAEARQIEAEKKWWQQIANLDPVDEAVRRHEAAGTLPATIFPGRREADNTWSSAFVDVEFPAPPREEWQTIHKARLTGFDVSAAVPAGAIKIKGLAEAARAVRNAPAIVDPIIFGSLPGHESRVVVFRYYNTTKEDSTALKALIDVLEEMPVSEWE